jgi:hypothetical protein
LSADALGLIELLLVLGGALGLAIWQLVAARRARRRDRRDSDSG